MVVQLVGFLAACNNPGSLPPLVAGVLGAVITVWETFVPCFMFIFAGTPCVDQAAAQPRTERHRGCGRWRHREPGVVVRAFDVSNRTVGPLKVTVPDIGSVDPAAVGLSLVAALLVFKASLAHAAGARSVRRSRSCRHAARNRLREPVPRHRRPPP